MSIIGILASDFFSGIRTPGSQGNQSNQNSQATQNPQNAPNAEGGQSRFEQLRSEFQQLAQDLQSGNLSQAQSDYTNITQTLPGLAQTGNSNVPVLQAFNQLGKDLQAGNLQAAQQDYATVQQDAQQAVQQSAAHFRGHHHHREGDRVQQGSAISQNNGVVQAFGQLAQELQAGNLQGAQQAFATLQNDLQQIGGFISASSNGTGSNPQNAVTGSTLNVSA